jgi:uncharacterized protein DUF6883
VKLPGCGRAVVDAAKLRDYLLSEAHPVGRFKAVFFRSLGYEQTDWEQLETDLRRLALTQPAVPRDRNPYGRKYEVYGILTGPEGKRARVTTVWIVLDGEDFPRLVTAYPGDQP